MTGAELRKIRRGKLDLTQAELAVKLGLSTRTISEYENRPEAIPPAIALAVQALASASPS